MFRGGPPAQVVQCEVFEVRRRVRSIGIDDWLPAVEARDDPVHCILGQGTDDVRVGEREELESWLSAPAHDKLRERPLLSGEAPGGSFLSAS